MYVYLCIHKKYVGQDFKPRKDPIQSCTSVIPRLGSKHQHLEHSCPTQKKYRKRKLSGKKWSQSSWHLTPGGKFDRLLFSTYSIQDSRWPQSTLGI